LRFVGATKKGRHSKKPGKNGQGARVVWRNLAKAVRELERTCGEALSPYRPELHYMRGPGPKWHAKRTGTATKVAANSAILRSPHKIAKAHI